VNDTRVRLGAATPIQRFLDDPALGRAMPAMPRCAIWFADDQLRESATIGGNIVNASPAADAIPPLVAHDAIVELASRRGGKVETRRVPMHDFITGPGKTGLADDEILTAIECAALTGYGGSFEKVGHRRSLVISTVCLAAVVKLDPAGRNVEDVRLCIGGIGPVPDRLRDVEKFLKSGPLTVSRLEQAAEMPVSLVRSRTRQDYRRDVVRGFMLRGLFNAAQRAGAGPDVLSPELETACA
jgi:carbon-monoxide dehydrogenase medium subunit/xanthine dehydrogenase FAD-binding subunit